MTAFKRSAPILAAVLAMLVALVPRALALDRFVTTDELFWIGRSAAFARALEAGQYGQTFQTGHPGVTTMWTASLGMGAVASRELAPSRRDVSRREVSQRPGFLSALTSARRAFGMVTALGVGVAVWLLWRLFGAGPAIFGGLLLALDPFFLAHARLVHIDASLTLWLTLAVLAALDRWRGGGAGVVVLAGVTAGLALLSKAPALILLGVVPLSLVLVRGPSALRRPAAWRDLLAWGVLAAATYLLLWPAMWTAPLDTLGRVFGFVRDNANPEHAAVADARAGSLFYLLVLLVRGTPLMLAGLLALVVVRPRGAAGRAALALGLFALLFGVAMTVAAKNFDRYLLPIFPTLDVLAGLGLWLVVERLRQPRARRVAAATVGLGIVALGTWATLSTWPYLLTYANPLVPPATGARAAVSSGWGEGLDQIAAYLNEKPNAAGLKVGMPGEIYTTVLDTQFRGQVAPAEGADAAAYDYLVVYSRNRDLGERPPFFDESLLTWAPESTVTLNGFDYAWVYDTSAGAPVGAQFGDLASLDGYGLDNSTLRPGRRLELRLHWMPLAALPPGTSLLVELRPQDTRSQDVRPQDVRPQDVRPQDMRPQDGAGSVRTWTLPLDTGRVSGGWRVGQRVEADYQFPIGADLAPGAYVLAVRVADTDGRLVAVTRQPVRPAGVQAESDAVPLRVVEVRGARE
ncbi:MAG: glycosyltransferase family 39 protein [Chloroflexi bacterium]|nr:glycosyltransferase family 39 protein [Chloroflexota bacterium]